MNTTNNTEAEITMVTKAFTCEARQTYRLKVDLADCSVRVWDDVARHYTLCHALTAGSVRAAIAKARAV
jgi:hypothetical protein